jgi:maltooligosyltrehalose trehalohydrolase
VKRGRREEFAAFGWDDDAIPDPQAEETFRQSILDWSELPRKPHNKMFDWHRALIRLRRRLPALRDGRLERTEVRIDETAGWLAMARGTVLVACNFADASRYVPCSSRAEKKVVLSSDDGVVVEEHAIMLPPEAVVIVDCGGC